MKIKQQLLKLNHQCRPGGNYTKLSITIHSTGNANSTAENERAWLDNPSNKRLASWHYVVGEDIVIQAIPDNEEAWHAAATEGNRYSIGVEITESGDRQKVLETAAEFTALKLKELKLDINNIKQHHDWSGKNCPRILIDKSCIINGMDWKYFLGRVETHLKGGEVVEEEKRYQTVAELPEWARGAIQKLMTEGKIADGNKLDLTMDMVRVLSILSR